MDFSLISLSDAISLLEMYGEPVPKDPQEIYDATYDLLSQLSPEDPLPVGIQDLYIAQGLYDIRENFPPMSMSDILFASEDDLVDLATDLGLPEVDKERSIRILGYLGKLENDLNVIDALPLEVVEEIAVNLDCTSLTLLCRVSTKFTGLCQNKHVLKRIINNKGYRGDIEKLDTKALRSLCGLLESPKFVPRQAYALTSDRTLTNILDNIVQVSAGAGFYLFLSCDGQVYGSGDNRFGQLGLQVHVDNPIQVIPGLNNIIAVEAGTFHSLFITAGGQVYGLGSNKYGQLGRLRLDGDNNTPELIPELNNIKQVSCGTFHSLCLRDDGQVYGFGLNTDGQLGLGNKVRRNEPTLISKLKNIVQISAGENHSLCLRKDGKVYRFGNNDLGELGRKGSYLEPKLIPKLKNIVQVSAGNYHSLFLTATGQIYALGVNYNKQLGFLSIKTEFYTPKLVPDVKNIVQISAGYSHSLCLSADGQLHIFGPGIYKKDLNKIVDTDYPNVASLNQVISCGKGRLSDDLILI